MRKTCGVLYLFLLFLVSLPGVAHAIGDGALRYGGWGQGTVIFDGRGHARDGLRCEDCHSTVFDTKKKALITMQDHFSDRSCFKCHNIQTESPASFDCASCHRKVPSSSLSATPAIADIITKPIDQKDVDAYASGKFGRTLQSSACLSCHEQEQKTYDDKILPPFDSIKYHAGAHAALACATCHIGYKGHNSFTVTPHLAKVPKAAKNCASCHSQSLSGPISGFSSSVHALKTQNAMDCASCHNPHNEPPKNARHTVHESVVLTYGRCATCHDTSSKMAAFTSDKTLNIQEAHAFLPKREQHLAALTCIDCHTPTEGKLLVHAIQPVKKSVATCSTCHTSEGSLLTSRVARFSDAEAYYQQKYIPAAKNNAKFDLTGKYALLAICVLVALHGLGRVLLARQSKNAQTVKEYVYPLFVRVCHWINASAFLVLIVTGFSIHFQGGHFAMGMKTAVDVHSIVGVMLGVNFLAYIMISIASGDIRQYIPDNGVFIKMIRQAKYYCFGMFVGAEKPYPITKEKRFNPLQQMAYLCVFILGMPVLLVSGIAMLLPSTVTDAVISRACLAAIHYIIACCYVLFIVGHIYLTTTGHSLFSMIKGMFTGMHEHIDKK